MIFLKLLLLLLVFVAVDSVEQSDEYILLAVQDVNGTVMLIQTNFSIKSYNHYPYKVGNDLLTKPPNKLFLGSKALYGHLKDSDVIAYIQPSIGYYIDNVTIPGAKDMVFVGPDSEDNLYFYSPTSKTFSVYKFDEPTKIPKKLKGLESEDKLVVIGRDQCNKDWIYLLRCSSTINLFIFDLKADSIVLEYPNIISKCFEVWGVSPNGEKIYFLEEDDNKPRTIINEFTRFNSSRIRQFVVQMKIESFALGNNELFYVFGKPGYMVKIVFTGKKAEGSTSLIKGIDADWEISTIFVHQPTTDCRNPEPTS